MSAVIRVSGLEKQYRRMAPGAHLRTLKSALLERSLTRGLRQDELISALNGVNFSVGSSEAFGVIGGNGSGKSTLLKVLAGILSPSAGTVEVSGRVAALIELGAGFHPEISGRENVYINGAVLGLSRREVDERYESIVEFSGLGNFMEEPVKNYSSGMYVRLGFAVAIHTNPDVLMVDEVLAVGDEAFAHRCIRRIEEFLAAGKSLLLVSHSLDMVERLCDRVMWLQNGDQMMVGEPRRVIDAYRQAVAEQEDEGHRKARLKQEEAASENSADKERESQEEGHGEDEGEDQAEILRWGSGQAEIVSARLLDASGVESYHHHCGQPLTLEIKARAASHLSDFVFGVAISTPRGIECWGTNTDMAGFRSESFEGMARVEVKLPALRLAPGEYLVDVAVHSREGAPYDYRRKALAFTVTARDRGIGLYFPQHEWSFSGGVSLERDSPLDESVDSTA
ncbi:MAG: ABC transporter ATP-binding protein [Deltaproteobacteria bacterium]|nr:ABC transporter ATP-binding protein [Deltaproteobacteria bacterium]